jgi:O-antigen/teichoic acid export membrane protein
VSAALATLSAEDVESSAPAQVVAVEAQERARVPGALLMSLGTVGSGVLAYAFNAVAARALGPADYGPIAVLWAAMFLVAIVLFRPVEQTLSRAVAERAADGQDAWPAVRLMAMLAGVTIAVACSACAIAWGPITDRLFDGHGFLTAMLIVGIAGYGASYFVRGVVGGRRWYAGYGVLLLADGGVRVAVALPLLAVASMSLAAAALASALAPLLVRGGRDTVRSLGGRPGADFRLPDATRFAGSTAVLAAGDQVLLSGGPVLVMLHGGPHASAAAGVVFAATMLVRAPAYLFQGVAAALLPNLTTMLVRNDEHGFRRAVTQTVSILSALACAMVVGAFVAGPFVMGILYGDGFDAGRLDLSLLAAGAGGYLIAATLSQAALARSEEIVAAVIWAMSAAVFVGLELALHGAALHRVAVAFCAAALANAAAFWLLSLRTRPAAAAQR